MPSRSAARKVSGRPTALLISLAVALVALVALAYLSAHLRDMTLEQARTRVEVRTAPYASAIGTNVNTRFAMLSGLHEFVSTSLPAGPGQAQFDDFASGLIARSAGVRALQVAPDGIFTLIYPAEGNPAPGLNLFEDERPEVQADIKRTMAADHIIISGPYDLRQSGLGMVGRQVVRSGDGTFWGFVAMVIDVPPILAEAGLDTTPTGLRFALSDEQGRVFAGDKTVVNESPFITSIPLPDGSWQLATVPAEGWDKAAGSGQLLLWIVGIILVLGLAVWVYLVATYQDRLRGMVETQTAQLREQHDLLERVTETSPVGISLVGTDGRFTMANAAAARVLGVTRDEMLGRRYDDPGWHLLDEVGDPLPPEAHAIGRTLSSGATVVGAHRSIEWPDGTRRVLSVSASPLRNASGTIDAVVAMYQDETDSVLAEQHLAAERARLAAIIEGTSDAIYVKDAEGRYLLCNEAVSRTVGRPSAEILGLDDTALFPGDNARIIMEGDRRVMESGVVQTYQELVTDSAGSARTFLSTKGPMRGPDGSITGIFGIARDVTEMEDTARCLRESQAALSTAQEIAHLGSWDINANNEVTWSAEEYRIYGVSPESFELTLESFAGLLHPEDAGRMQTWLEECRAGGAPGELEVRTIHPDGSVHTLLGNGEAFFDEQGELTHLTGTTQDITERKKIERELELYREHLEELVQRRTLELQAANDELVDATTAKSQFLASMSHELRTPLNSIIGFSDMLFRGLVGELTEEQRKQIGMVHRSGMHLLALINDVLDLSKIEAGALEVNIEPVDPVEIMMDVAETLGPLALEKEIELRVAVPEVDRHIDSDGSKIRQILLNLGGNAIKFTDTGGIELRLEFTTDDVRFSVSDTGRGIKLKDLTRIFDAFAQVSEDAAMKPEGTGLGLAISREYAQVLGGRIVVESEPDKGSTFTLVLPAN